MTLRRRLIIAASIPAGIVLFLVLTVLFVPDRELQGAVVRGAASQGYTLSAAAIGKSFPLGISGRDLRLSTGAGEVLRLDSARFRLRLLPLVVGKVVVSCRVRMAGGELEGDVSPFGRGGLSLKATGVRLQDIQFFSTVAGCKVQGVLRGTATFAGRGVKTHGQLQLEVDGAEVSGVKIKEMPLPDAAYRSVRGMLRVADGKVVLESFTLEGDGLYARLKGDLPVAQPLSAAPLNVVLELMPKPEVLDRQKLVFLLLMKFQTAPGHYEVPIRGTLGRPAVF